MQPLSVTKFCFRIRTRSGGVVVDNLFINGHDEEDATRRLRQMYRDCEILACQRQAGAPRTGTTSFEDVVDLLTG